MKLILLSLLLSMSANAACVMWTMTPTKPNQFGCVGWNIVPVPISDTNCKPAISFTDANPLARNTLAADPQDCIYQNHGGHIINLCGK